MPPKRVIMLRLQPRFLRLRVMNVWVDADACPVVIKDMLFRAARRTHVLVTLVANQALLIPASPYIKALRVAITPDAADQAILDRAARNDLVVTADIPLAAHAVRLGAMGLSPRGVVFNQETIGAHVATRNLMTDLRDTGAITGGPATLSLADRQNFANHLDAWLARLPALKTLKAE